MLTDRRTVAYCGCGANPIVGPRDVSGGLQVPSDEPPIDAEHEALCAYNARGSLRWGHTLNSVPSGDQLVDTLIHLGTASIVVRATLWRKLRRRGTDRSDVGRILAFSIMQHHFAIQKRIFYKSPNHHYSPRVRMARHNTSSYVLDGFVRDGNGWIVDCFGV